MHGIDDGSERKPFGGDVHGDLAIAEAHPDDPTAPVLRGHTRIGPAAATDPWHPIHSVSHGQGHTAATADIRRAGTVDQVRGTGTVHSTRELWLSSPSPSM